MSVFNPAQELVQGTSMELFAAIKKITDTLSSSAVGDYITEIHLFDYYGADGPAGWLIKNGDDEWVYYPEALASSRPQDKR